MEARFEEIRKKYQSAKRGENNIDFLSLKLQIESFIEKLRASNKKKENLLNEAHDILIDLIKLIEESRCQPFRLKKL